MAEFPWESETVGEATLRQPAAVSPASEPETLALSANDFSALEDRILRAVNMVRRERQIRAEAQERATLAEAQLREQAQSLTQLQKELNSMRAERDRVLQRIDRLLAQLDALEL
jgi:septal ring factor EnvC (AmiA/AmiB activator)